jgi:L-methionine (R)-S-oxide reductase
MRMRKSAISTLREGFAQLSTDGSLQECLNKLSELTAAIVGARDCIILLFDEAELAGAALPDEACFGSLASRLSARGKGANSVIPLAARRGVSDGDAGGHKENMVSAIVLHGRTVGVIHARGPLHQRDFSMDDLYSFNVVTPIVARSIQVNQLQNILKSRFAQLALSRMDGSTTGNLTGGIVDHPNQIARLLARAFYREMLKAGFDFNQILFAATEVISELSTSLRKHSAKKKERANDNGDSLTIIDSPSVPRESMLQKIREDASYAAMESQRHAD